MFLGIDLGTTNVKAILVDECGRVHSRGQAGVELFHTSEGGVEQDIEQIFQATVSAIRGAVAGSGANVTAVGVSSQGGALQLLDSHGAPAGRVISWLDSRGSAFDRDFTQRMGGDWLLRHTGHDRACTTIGQLLRLRAQRDTRLDGGFGIGFVGDCIVGRLCGRRAHDATSLSLAMLLNPLLKQADEQLLNELEIDPRQLPDLIAADCPAGGIGPDIARLTSLPEGIPISPAVHDQYACALGLGVSAPGDVMLGAGTAWVLVAVDDKPPGKPCDGAFLAPHPIEGLWGELLTLNDGGSSFKWAIDLCGLQNETAGEIDERLIAAGPGADGLVFHPQLATGKGRITGISIAHNANHLLRAVVEGLAFEVRRRLDMLRSAGAKPGVLCAGGKAAASPATRRIIADAVGLPVRCMPQSETSALGAAIIAARMVQPTASWAQVVARMSPCGDVVEPSGDADAYTRLYERYIAGPGA
ncbi:MAG: FGGY-family carbohydrate kinase [Planctomycetes bacterium]|nr:FGGY-family carbohydrate kinase [Planctomycetota bacterium]